tara:strand:- start:344 stop:1327 length:984 start_codon:yes stop_codon:yes gene_type:complete
MTIPNTASTANLNQVTDKPKNARADLLNTCNGINQLISGYNLSNGLVALDSNGKIDSNKLNGLITQSALNGNVFQASNIKDSNGSSTGVENEHFRNSTLTYDKFAQISSDNTLGGNNSSNTILPSQKAVKTHIDTLPTVTYPSATYSMSNMSGSGTSRWYQAPNATLSTNHSNIYTTTTGNPYHSYYGYMYGGNRTIIKIKQAGWYYIDWELTVSHSSSGTYNDGSYSYAYGVEMILNPAGYHINPIDQNAFRFNNTENNTTTALKIQHIRESSSSAVPATKNWKCHGILYIGTNDAFTPMTTSRRAKGSYSVTNHKIKMQQLFTAL